MAVTDSRRRLFVRVLRGAVVLLVVSAEVYLIRVLGEAFTPANHYSYFTVLSNVFGAAVLGVGIFRRVPDVVRGAAATYLATTGVVYALLLRGVDVQTPAYANVVLHVAVPVLVVLEWVAVPPERRLGARAVTWWLLFPALYCAYTLVRGPLVAWYPYPFLDPRDLGYGAVAGWCVVVAATVTVVGALVAWVGAARRRGSTARSR